MTEVAIKNGKSRDVTRVGQSTMTEVAIKNGQSRDITRVGQRVK